MHRKFWRDKVNEGQMALLITYTIIILLSALLSLREKGVFHKIIAFGFVCSIFLSWFENETVSLISLILVILLGFLTSIYGLKVNGLFAIERIGISTLGFCFVLNFVSKIMHFPWVGSIRLFTIIPIVVYLISLLVNKKLITKETSFMITWIDRKSVV